MGKTAISSRQLSANTQNDINGLQNVERILSRLTTDLQSVKDLQIYKPARYYHAYRSYTLDFGIMQLEQLDRLSQPLQKQQIQSLLSAYILLKSIIHN